ncbi:SDR family oxidoreductase [Anaerobacillus sp. HL2]|nr:SDR family oxidoreductase [Anaerobacillus sp. HL2]
MVSNRVIDESLRKFSIEEKEVFIQLLRKLDHTLSKGEMMAKVLVTGSTGNIGSFVVRKLVEKGVAVKVVVTNEERGKEFFKQCGRCCKF